MVQHAQEDDGSVPLADIDRFRRVNPRRDQERECGDASDLHAVVVVDLVERLVVSQGVLQGKDKLLNILVEMKAEGGSSGADNPASVRPGAHPGRRA